MWHVRISRISPGGALLFISKRLRSQTSAEIRKSQQSITRALAHYDDFYSSVYGKKWPSLRLALLTAPKYIAFPNTFSEQTADLINSLETMGALDIKNIWKKGREAIDARTPFNQAETEANETEEVTRLADVDRAVVSYAETKVAEEMDILYQNAPERKSPVRATEGVVDDRRVLRDVREASQEYITATKMIGMDEFHLESEYFTTYGKEEEEANTNAWDSIYKFTNIDNYSKIVFPPYLRPYCFEAGNATSFPAAGRDSHAGLREYLCVNGASLAPILGIDLKICSKVLDLCAGPGTKSLLMLMTMCPEHLTCNDLESSRIGRIKKIFKEFIGVSEPQHVDFTRYSAAKYPCTPTYDCVLADVPCTTDRISLTVNDNNIFKSQRTQERLSIVKLQKDILLNAFKCLLPKPGSTCVYSTCSLSPIENDGVVGAALKENLVPNLAVDLLGLWHALLPLQAARLFHLSRTKFGVIIEPNVCSNFGPMYVSRIIVQPPSMLE